MQRLLSQAKHIDQWNKRIQRILPGPIAAHCQVTNVTEDKLVIQVNSPAWASKLRLFIPKLEKTIIVNGLQSVELKVAIPAPAYNAIKEIPTPRSPLSSEASNTIIQTAETINDKNLREALLRLAAQSNKTR